MKIKCVEIKNVDGYKANNVGITLGKSYDVVGYKEETETYIFLDDDGHKNFHRLDNFFFRFEII